MLRLRFLAVASLVLISATAALAQGSAGTSDEERVALHESPEWINLAEHLPDPATASAADLETAGDVLNARRFPEDALDYYGYAVARGAKLSTLLNKMGVVRLQLGQTDIAHQMFLRVTHEDKKNAIAWNNLAATEFVAKKYDNALGDYRKATSLDKKNAAFRANLGLTYFEMGKMEDMRAEFAAAVALDPTIFVTRESGGTTARLLASGDYPKMCLELARLDAQRGNLPGMRLWLGKASAGINLVEAMDSDPVLKAYMKDPEVAMIVRNAESLRKMNVAASRHAPSLGNEPRQAVPATQPTSEPVPSSKLI